MYVGVRVMYVLTFFFMLYMLCIILMCHLFSPYSPGEGTSLPGAHDYNIGVKQTSVGGGVVEGGLKRET
jgi:hypothetical protein